MDKWTDSLEASPRRQGNTVGQIASLSKGPRLFDQVRAAIRVRHYSFRTEETYVQWIRRFILFHHKRHPRDMGAPGVASSTQPSGVRSTDGGAISPKGAAGGRLFAGTTSTWPSFREP